MLAGFGDPLFCRRHLGEVEDPNNMPVEALSMGQERFGRLFIFLDILFDLIIFLGVCLAAGLIVFLILEPKP